MASISIPIAAVIGAGATMASGKMSSDAAKSAAGQQTGAMGQALDYQRGIYGTTQSNLTPYVGAGQDALRSILGYYGLPGGNSGGPSGAFGQFQQTPFYQFPLQQGNLALQRQLASSGLTGSGAALKDAIAYNQGYASQGLSQWLQGLGGIASAGQGAAGTIGQQGNVAAGTLGQGAGYIGNAAGQGIINANNAMTQGVNNALPFLIGNNGASSYSGAGGQSSALGGLFSGIGKLFSSGGGGTPADALAMNAAMTQTGGTYGPAWG